VEYATREQAQNAVATLSNQNLMGRLVYVREDREAEPRFSNPSTTRGGGPGFAPNGGGHAPYGGGQFGGHGGFQGGGPPGGSRQVYVANVCIPCGKFCLLCANIDSFLTMSDGRT
jgi:RNA recognition motif-containing protein